MKFKLSAEKFFFTAILLLIVVLLAIRFSATAVITSDVHERFKVAPVDLDNPKRDGFDFGSIKQKLSAGTHFLKDNWRFCVHDESETVEIVSTKYLQQQVEEIVSNYDEEIKLKQNNVADSLAEYRKNRQIQAKVLFEEKSVNLQEQLDEEIRKRIVGDAAALEQYRREVYNTYRLKIATLQVKSVLEKVSLSGDDESESKSEVELKQLNESISVKVAQRQKEQNAAFVVFSEQKQTEFARELRNYNDELQSEISADVASFEVDGNDDLQMWQRQRTNERDRAIGSRTSKKLLPEKN